MQRTMIGKLAEMVGETVKVAGWVQTKRDHGKLTFIDLRDRSGVVQCVGYQKMGELSEESVVELEAVVKARPERLVNAEQALGKIELDVQSYEIVGVATELPIPIDGDGYDINEEVRIQYRYLDLRRARLQKMLKMRSDFTHALRLALVDQLFVEVETPLLTKSTKEGARDFVVPSRQHPGKFYALPQSPQQYKQLLMTAGVERYFQFARCIRDEDLRADRGFEFTQLDLEMSFVTQRQVMEMVESLVKQAVKAVGGTLQQDPFPVFSYPEAMEKYGADKFDLRSDSDKEQGVLAFAWVERFPFFKQVDTGDVVEVRDGKSGWTFTHNPFSMPLPEHEDWHLAGERIGEIVTQQYDLVCNGYEVGGGSIRAHKPEILRATFKIMGYSDEQIEEGIGHMLKAFTVGTPPHGGIALGMDRLVMLLLGETSLREVVPFPMTSSGRTAIMDAPNIISAEQLAELSLVVK